MVPGELFFQYTGKLEKNIDAVEKIKSGVKEERELSGGEVQKIEIVESLLKDTDMLIIDEGTSNIDFNAERIVLNELFKKYKDKIFIFICT
jgi:ATP-binding cassette subfamily B protein